MRRREFITLLGGAAAWPVMGRAQQMPVIGFLSAGSAGPSAPLVSAFRRGLAESGFIEGSNIAVEYHYTDGRNDRLPAMAADLVNRRPNVIVAPNNASALAAKMATTAIPIVFSVSVDPVASGLVSSLSRPSGNLTGVTTLNVELGPKRIELARELVPPAASIALLVNPNNPAAETDIRQATDAARTLGLQLTVLHARSEQEFDAAFAALADAQARALVIAADAFFNGRSEQLAGLALRHAVPAIYQYREFAAAGGLMSYGGSLTELYQRVGTYTGRILKGERPAELPVQQATKIEMIINLKTARTLGLIVPLSLLGRADEVIE